MTTYSKSNGERITQIELDKRIREAKQIKKDEFFDQWGYYFCETCKSSNKSRYDMSHDVSVQECKMSGKTELAYDVDNLKIRCRECHNKYDKLT